MTLDLTGCYYRRLDADGEFQVFESTELTASGWGPNLQHGSPPMALLLKAIEELPEPRENLRIGRVALDILGPVPLEPVRVRAWIERPGRRIALAVAEMEARANGGYRAGQRLVIGNLRDGRQGQRSIPATARISGGPDASSLRIRGLQLFEIG